MHYNYQDLRVRLTLVETSTPEHNAMTFTPHQSLTRV